MSGIQEERINNLEIIDLIKDSITCKKMFFNK
jgi:hypothetical protein